MDVEAFFGFLVLPGAVQQRLGRNATHVQAGAAKGQFALTVSVLLDTGSAQTGCAALDGSYVAAKDLHQSPQRQIFATFKKSSFKRQAVSCKPQAKAHTLQAWRL